MSTITATRRPRRHISHPRAFWAITGVAVLFPAASAVPSPLYSVYQEEWGFSSGTLTAIFSIYALALLVSLLVVGALSDHIGRRPVLLGAVAGEVLSIVLFLLAGDVLVLALARVVQGLATGAAIATLGATLIDLQPTHAPGRGGLVNGVAPTSGLALGAMGAGLLAQLAPAPTTLVFVVLLVALLAAGVAVAAIPETSSMRPGGRASLRPRIGLPGHLRGDMLAITPVLLASWALGGLYMSLGPSVAASLLGVTSHLVGGLVVALLCATAAATAMGLQSTDPRSALRLAAAMMTGGMAVTLVGVDLTSLPLAALGTVLAGFGFGASALGAFGTLAAITRPEERSEVFSLVYVISYLAFSVPAAVAGYAATGFGLRGTVLVYGAGVAALAAVALTQAQLQHRARRRGMLATG